jgi:hypothetical protein
MIYDLYDEDMDVVYTELTEKHVRILSRAEEILSVLSQALEALQPYYDDDNDGSIVANASNAVFKLINDIEGE